MTFTRATRHPHPHLQDAFGSCRGLLAAMGRTPEQIAAILREMAPEFFDQ